MTVGRHSRQKITQRPRHVSHSFRAVPPAIALPRDRPGQIAPALRREKVARPTRTRSLPHATPDIPGFASGGQSRRNVPQQNMKRLRAQPSSVRNTAGGERSQLLRLRPIASAHSCSTARRLISPRVKRDRRIFPGRGAGGWWVLNCTVLRPDTPKMPAKDRRPWCTFRDWTNPILSRISA
jgi:hypothetical protein